MVTNYWRCFCLGLLAEMDKQVKVMPDADFYLGFTGILL
jgi:hypothetical protein